MTDPATWMHALGLLVLAFPALLVAVLPQQLPRMRHPTGWRLQTPRRAARPPTQKGLPWRPFYFWQVERRRLELPTSSLQS